LLYGDVPAWRTLSAGMTGTDVRALNTALVRLGYATAAALGPRPGWNFFSSETAYALEHFEAHLGFTSPTGSLGLGQAVFLPSPVKITAWAAAVAPGVAAAAGAVLMTATSDSPAVTIALDTSQQAEVKAGDTVSVTLPRGNSTPGVVTSVGTVATTSATTHATTITVLVALKRPAQVRHLSSAPVTVSITTGVVRDALVVPVTGAWRGCGRTGSGSCSSSSSWPSTRPSWTTWPTGCCTRGPAWQTVVTTPPRRWHGWGSATSGVPAPPSCPAVSGSESR
jgi:hypothetical protein